MQMKRTMKTEDMKFIHEELLSLNHNGVINETGGEHPLIEAEMVTRKIGRQAKVVTLAENMLNICQTFRGDTGVDPATQNYESFLEQTTGVLSSGNYLNDRNYKSLLVLVSSVAFNTHKIKMESLVTKGYWEGITLDDLPMQQYNTGTAVQNEQQ